MGAWFDRTIVESGRLPLFFLLVAFILTFLFIRFSVRMIRAEVSWWPGNVTPGGVHVHHVFFGMMLMLLSGFGFVAVDPFRTPVVDCILAALFGIGAALVLDEFALLLHLRDVYWAEEGRTSIDAVFVGIAIGLLFLVGLQPFGVNDAVGQFNDAADAASRVGVILGVGVNVALAIITLLKGKIWTGLVGLFFPLLILVGAIRVARPHSPWARWRYRTRPRKLAKATDREERFRKPLMRWKIVVQEAVAGRFGVPDTPPAPLPQPIEPKAPEHVPGAIASAIRWRRTRKQLRTVPTWRLPVLLVTLAIVAAWVTIGFDEFLELQVDSGTLATLLSVIAGSMATLTGLVFTAVTLAMQFGGTSISVRVIPMLQREPVMRWSIGFFLATFVYSVIIAIELSVGDPADPTPGLSTAIAFGMTTVSAYLFIALVVKVGRLLNTAHLLRWIANDGRAAVRRQYPDDGLDVDSAADDPVRSTPPDERHEGESAMVVALREIPSRGRVLLAVNVDRLQRYAAAWGVQIDLLVSVGDHVPHGVPVIEVRGALSRVSTARLLRCLYFGDAHQPSVSPTAALQTISDIALKALSSAVNDPSTSVHALDHTEDLLLMLAPRVRAESATPLTGVGGIRRTWSDYVAIGTDEIRRQSRGQAQVQRRLRALFETLLAECADDQREPVCRRLTELDELAQRDWPPGLDRRLASTADRQGYGSEWGRDVQS